MKFKSKEDLKIDTSDVTIIINSCDAYLDVVDVFLISLQTNWPDNPFKVIINNESNPILNYTEKEKQSKKWGERLIDLISKINTKYCILLFDDYILEGPIVTKNIYSILNILVDDPFSSVFYLNAACVKDHEDEKDEDYRLLKDNVDYRLNSVPSIWKTYELLRYTKKFDNPWSWEVFGSYRTYNNKRNFYSASSQLKNNFPYNYSKGGAIYRGKWVKEVIEDKVHKYNLNLDLSKRGFVNLDEKFKRTYLWKIKFILLGFKSIRFKMIIYIYRSIKHKISYY